MRLLLWPAMIAIAIGACSASSGENDRPSPSQPEPSASAAPSGHSNVPARVLDEIVADAATRAGVDPADVAVLSAEQRTWGDGSLGCPQPGMAYTQVQVDGYQVIVSAGGVEYDYRVGQGRPRLCAGGARSS